MSAWTGDLDSLKQFVKEHLKLDGIWSQPRSDKRVFSADGCLTSWPKNNKLLTVVEGYNENQVKKGFFQYLIEDTVTAGDYSSNSSIISETENLKTS